MSVIIGAPGAIVSPCATGMAETMPSKGAPDEGGGGEC
jgi:hypothetical protein